MSSRDWKKLVIAIALCEGVGLLGSIFTAPAIPVWYAGLKLPMLAPPNWVFGPVWTTLFALMGTALFLVWQKKGKRKEVSVAVWIFASQLVFNFLWSMIFFGFQNPGAAFIEIVFLWILIAATIASFARVSRLAALLLVPYLLWVSFASYLNFSIWLLNS